MINAVKSIFGNMPLQRKLMLLIGGLMTLAALFATFLVVVLGYLERKSRLVEERARTDKILAVELAPSLYFGAAADVNDALEALNYDPWVNFASVRRSEDPAVVQIDKPKMPSQRDSKGVLFASFMRSGQVDFTLPESRELTQQIQSARVVDGFLEVTTPIVRKGKVYGSLQVWTDLSPLRASMLPQIGIYILANLAALGAALFLLHLFIRWISRPITHLMERADTVSKTHDYSIRAKRKYQDEFGQLADHFNQMLERIETQNKSLEQEHEEDRKELKEKLVRAQRLESIGLLAGGVAHDLNNILGPMVALPDVISARLGEESEVKDELKLIGNSAGKAATVIRDLLTLSRRGNIQLAPIDINATVQESVEDLGLRERLGGMDGVTVDVSLQGGLPQVSGSDAHLTRVILNLVINAAEACCDGGGTVRVSTQYKKIEELASFYEEIPPGEYVALEVSDSGTGIPVEHMEHILEPFYSRKVMGQSSGTGLGLAIVYGIIKDHQGFIDIWSEQGSGTRFTVFIPCLPVAQSTAAAATNEPLSYTRLGKGKKMLVIDDDPGQRQLAASLLKGFGYDVDVATCGREGVVMAAGSSYDLFLVDMVMEPDFDGYATYQALRKNDPKVKVMITTGFSESDRVKSAMELGARSFLPKPYTADELAEAVMEAMH